MRIDKWLWAARFYKTRSLATEDLKLGRITVNGLEAKPSRELRIGDRVGMRQQGLLREVTVCLLLPQRGPATVAQTMYEELPESIARREAWAQARRDAPEPAQSLTQGRPTKRDRRDQERWRRWGASLD